MASNPCSSFGYQPQDPDLPHGEVWFEEGTRSFGTKSILFLDWAEPSGLGPSIVLEPCTLLPEARTSCSDPVLNRPC